MKALTLDTLGLNLTLYVPWVNYITYLRFYILKIKIRRVPIHVKIKCIAHITMSGAW